MNANVAPRYPRARTIRHPGPFNPVRIQSRRADSSRHFRLLIQPGTSLYDGIVQPLVEMGVHSASTTILGGTFERLAFCMGGPDPNGQSIATYTSTVEAGRTYLVFGNATMGKNAEGRPIVHCHAVMRTESGGMKGGHLITQDCIAAEPIVVFVTTLEGFELRVAFDPETNISLIQPLDRPREGERS
jgi:predicted DNA-binding protein with PD1-like motif